MNTYKALEIKKALLTLADFLDMKPEQIASNICFLDKDRFAKLKKASDVWNKFDNTCDIVERGKLLGVEIIKE